MAGTGSLVAAFRPSVASLGYALFLAINATAVWGGVFPFLPLEIQSQHTMFWFFLVEASVFAAVFLASVVGSYFCPARPKRFLLPLASLSSVLGWVC
ncbi:MAG: LuxR family transcriptional regulator, partial [Eggerthellaceae bacterium]|nr:LuxR family transcriptional regulator [Eggerthellaceae bacterium]